MKKDNLRNTIISLYKVNEIRSVWDSDKEDYYFSVVDVIRVLTNSNDPKDYWYRLKKECQMMKNLKYRQNVDD